MERSEIFCKCKEKNNLSILRFTRRYNSAHPLLKQHTLVNLFNKETFMDSLFHLSREFELTKFVIKFIEFCQIYLYSNTVFI